MREKVNLDEREKMTVITDFADMTSKNAIDWRKLFFTTLDQALHFYPSQILNGMIIVSLSNAIFEAIDH